MRHVVSMLVLAGVLAGAAARPTLAHHSFAAEFDRNLPIELTGVVTRLDWINPHAFVYLDVKDASGNVTAWEIELGSPNGLMRRGWTRNSLKVGDQVSLNGYRAKNGKNVVSAGRFTLADGRQVFSGSSADGFPVTPGGKEEPRVRP